jgi:hypothetical protein
MVESRPYPANLCPLSCGVEFACFGEDLGQPIGAGRFAFYNGGSMPWMVVTRPYLVKGGLKTGCGLMATLLCSRKALHLFRGRLENARLGEMIAQTPAAVFQQRDHAG